MLTRLTFIMSFCSLAVLGVSPLVQAQTCVVLDTDKDALAPTEQHAAATFVRQALIDAKEPVGAAPCDQPYVLYHLKFGALLTVHIESPRGARQATASSLEDLPALYQQLVTSLVNGLPLAASNATTDRTNVTDSQMALRRALPDSLIYVRLGYGQLVGGHSAGGTAVGFGYRQEVDELGIDVSVANLIVGQDQDLEEEGRTSGSWIRVHGLYFLKHRSNMSPYVGAGMAWAFTTFQSNGRDYTGSGPQGELTAGLEFLRASTVRLFIQLDASLPIYRASVQGLDGSPSGGNARDAAWVPTFALSLGAGLRP